MPKPDVSAARRNQILEAAAVVFSRAGFHEARMEDIADQAGLSKGAVYLYFAGKDALIAALLRRLFDVELEALRRLDIPAAGFEEKLLGYTRHLAAEYERIAAESSSLVREFYAVAARDKGVQVFLRQYLRAYRDLLATLIEEGIARRELRSVDPQAAAIAILALYEGLMVLWVADPRAVQWREHSEAAIRYLLDGLRSHRSTKSRMST